MKYKVFSLSLPYIIFVFRFDSANDVGGEAFAFCRTRPLRDQRDTLCFFPLTNTSPGGNGSNGGSICMSGTKVPDLSAVGLSSYVEEFRTTFWQSEFTQDYNDNILWLSENCSSRFSSLDTWASWSARSPADVLQIDFQEHKPLKFLLGDRESGILNHLYTAILREIKDAADSAVAQVYAESSQWVDDFSDMLQENPKLVEKASDILQGYLTDATADIRRAYQFEIAKELGELEQKIEIAASRIMGEDPKTEAEEVDMSSPW